MKYQAIIFDLFGTLVETATPEYHELILNEMGEILGLPIDDLHRLWNVETYQARMTGVFDSVEANLQHICRALGVPVSTDQIDAAARIRLHARWRRLIPLPGASEVLGHLRSAGYRIGLVSDSSFDIPSEWRRSPLAPLVDVAVFSCEMGCKKPDPRIYVRVCDGLGVRPADCLYVGDGSSSELTGARNVGMHPVLIRSSTGASDTYETVRPDVENWQGDVVWSLREILDLVGLE